MPVAIPGTNAVTAEIVATIDPFSGDLRAAFRRIDQLAADISERTSFTETVVVEYPIDASPASSITGELGGESARRAAQFRLHLTYPLESAQVANSQQGGGNEGF